MQDLKRPLTVRFPTRGLGRLAEGDVIQVLTHKVKVENIKAIQITEDECRVTVTDVTTRQTLIVSHVTIKDNEIVMSDVSRSSTKVTIKDAPYEMDDADVISKLRNFGEIVEGSMRRGKVRGTNIETGTRYLSLYDAVEVIPSEISLGDFVLRVYCDNNRTKCKHCGLTSHPHSKCPDKPKTQRSCFRCFSTSHMARDCIIRDCDE